MIWNAQVPTLSLLVLAYMFMDFEKEKYCGESSAEAEYVAAAKATSQGVWLLAKENS